MSIRPLNARTLTMKAIELQNAKKFKAARLLVFAELNASVSITKSRQKMLLNILIGIELHAGRPLEAVKVLRRRRSLGSTTWSKRLEDHFQAAQLLAQGGKWSEARAELVEMFTDKDFSKSDGFLRAIELYFDLEQECRSSLGPILERAAKVAIQRYRIPVSKRSKVASLEEIVTEARFLYREAGSKYQALLIRAFADVDREERAV